MNVRPATPGDVAAIADVERRTWLATYGEHLDAVVLAALLESRLARWEAMFREDGQRVVVADQDGAVVGFASWGPSRDEDADGVGELCAIYVAPEAQGAGVGTVLHDVVLQRLREMGFAQVTLWTLAANARARSFYEKAGWTVESQTEQPGGWGRPKIRYRRAL